MRRTITIEAERCAWCGGPFENDFFGLIYVEHKYKEDFRGAIVMCSADCHVSKLLNFAVLRAVREGGVSLEKISAMSTEIDKDGQTLIVSGG